MNLRVLSMLVGVTSLLPAFALVASADDITQRDGGVPLITSSQYTVSGEVIARTETDFTVLTRDSRLVTVQVNRDTAITKGAESIRLSEVMIGDKVNVTVLRGGDGNLQAVAVAVRTGYE